MYGMSTDNTNNKESDINVQKLAELARIDVTDNELKELENELPAILDFVEQVGQAHSQSDTHKHTGEHYNIMRDDGEPHKSGKYTAEIVEAFPKSKDGYLAVKKIINQS